MSSWKMTVEGNGPPSIDRDEVRRALGLLVDPDATHEIRALPSGRSVPVHGGDIDAAVRAIDNHANAKGVYVTLNPCRADLGDRAARHADILCRRHLLIDHDRCSAIKAIGGKESNATEEEKDGIWNAAERTRAFLTSQGWPQPIVIDSGNGWHLLYRIDLPNDKLSQQIVSACLKSLAKRFDDEWSAIGVECSNSARITKLPGTWVRKGPHTADRPHRMARLCSIPHAITPVPVELIKAVAGIGEPAEPVEVPPQAWIMQVPRNKTGIEKYLDTAFRSEVDRLANAREGERNVVLNAAAFNLGQLVSHGLDRSVVESILTETAHAIGLGEHETQGTLRSGLEAGMAVPRVIKNKEPPPQRAIVLDDDNRPVVIERLTIRASEITPQAVRWLWTNRIPIGMVSLFAGKTGLGKSFVTCDLAARITRGEDLPDGPSGLAGEPRTVLMISEDPYEIILAPRLIELGADMQMVHFLTWEAMAHYTLTNTDMLERAYVESGKPALVVIDPPTNFLGQTDEHKNAEVRAVLMHLVGWIKDKESALILITHVNKGAKGVEALSRVIGSVAWTTTTRVVHIFAPDPDDATKCLFLPEKIQVGAKPKALRYSFRQTDTLATIDWHGEVEASADDALSAEKPKPRRIAASEWMIEQFRTKREWPSDDLFRAAKEAGLSRNAVFEAKEVLQLPRARQVTAENGDKAYVWWVPPDWEHFKNDRADGPMGQ